MTGSRSDGPPELAEGDHDGDEEPEVAMGTERDPS